MKQGTKNQEPRTSLGFGLLEMIAAVGVWIVIVSAGVGMLLGGLRVNRLADESALAAEIASEGMDAVNSIKKQGWLSPFLSTSCVSGCGIATSSGTWGFLGVNNVIGKFTRQIFVTATTDPDTYKVESRVTWNRGIPPITNTTSLITYLANFAKAIISTAGLLVYGDGTTTPKTRNYDKANDTFSAEANTVTGASGVSFGIRTSPIKVEAISGYITNGGVLQIMCFDGTAWTNEWNVTVGGAGTTKRFDIAYETNSGDVMVLYSGNVATTNELRYRTKLGSAGCGTGNWSTENNLDPIRTTGTVQWVKMAWDKRSNSNLITAIWADDNSDLSAMIWSGTAWGNEPTTALATTLQVITTPQDTEDFDVEYESLSGDVMVAWGIAVGNNTNGVRYSTCTGGTAGCAWSGIQTPATFADDATNLDMAGNLNSDEIVLASIGVNQNDLQIGYWNGSAWTNTANADTSCNGPVVGSRLVATGWLVSGATSRSVVRYADQGSSAVDWYTGNGGTFTKQTDFTQTPAPNGPIYMDIQIDPIGKNQLISLVADSANDLFAKRLSMDATPTFAWTNSDGVALETTLPQTINSPYAFAYWRQ